jgi:hypothetical protein
MCLIIFVATTGYHHIHFKLEGAKRQIKSQKLLEKKKMGGSKKNLKISQKT